MIINDFTLYILLNTHHHCTVEVVGGDHPQPGMQPAVYPKVVKLSMQPAVYPRVVKLSIQPAVYPRVVKLSLQPFNTACSAE